MNREFALTLWRADLVRFGLDDRQLVTGKHIIKNHSGWLRRYHGLSHLAFLFKEIEALSDQIDDLPRLIYAAWFHDAIYKSWRNDNEQRSADWAQAALVDMGATSDLASRVHSLILATADHAGGGIDADDALFLDMDCAILGTDPDAYDQYARQVRAEHLWAPPQSYKKGRAAFLTRQLERERLFHTAAYQDRFEAQARANMQRELAKLTR
ncbi:metal-dependent phosphohydrolase [Oceanicaulis alexandrii]|uniref:HD domain-containing protein n=1 Tax=Oceanicaulis alexandrii TaxID=153233 RepID=UPI0035D0368A